MINDFSASFVVDEKRFSCYYCYESRSIHAFKIKEGEMMNSNCEGNLFGILLLKATAFVVVVLCVCITPLPLFGAKYSTRIRGYPVMFYKGDIVHIEDDFGTVDMTITVTQDEFDIFQMYQWVNNRMSGTSEAERAYYNDSDMGVVGRQIWSIMVKTYASLANLATTPKILPALENIIDAILTSQEIAGTKFLQNNPAGALESYELWTAPANYNEWRADYSGGFRDPNVAGKCNSPAVYAEFRAWIMTQKSPYPVVENGENTWTSYEMGSDRVFENRPVVEISNVATSNFGVSGGASVTIDIVVRDGEDVAVVSSEKVAAMFEATSDLRDWEGTARLSPNAEALMVGQTSAVRVKVRPGDGTAPSAFLRLKGT